MAAGAHSPPLREKRRYCDREEELYDDLGKIVHDFELHKHRMRVETLCHTLPSTNTRHQNRNTARSRLTHKDCVAALEVLVTWLDKPLMAVSAAHAAKVQIDLLSEEIQYLGKQLVEPQNRTASNGRSEVPIREPGEDFVQVLCEAATLPLPDETDTALVTRATVAAVKECPVFHTVAMKAAFLKLYAKSVKRGRDGLMALYGAALTGCDNKPTGAEEEILNELQKKTF